jgi:hypothetical protein
VQKDVLGRLWRHCFYSRIGPQRARIAKEKRKQQQQGQQGQQQQQVSTTNSNAAAKLEKNLYFFLQEAVTLYEYLVEKLQSKLSNDKSTATSGTASASASQESTVASYSMAASASVGTDGGKLLNAATVDATKTAAAECLQRSWIWELHRWQSLISTERCYLTAAQLDHHGIPLINRHVS